MYIAKQKRKENIAEYILYLWQIEDLIRALDFNMERIYSVIVEPQGLEGQDRDVALAWYEGVATLLVTEGKRECGHMSHVDHLLSDLHDLHLRLLSMPVGQKYAASFSQLSADLPMLRSSLKDAEGKSDTEIMFMALYSVMLLRLKGGQEQSKHIVDVLELVSPVVAQLAALYRKVEQGEIDLFKEE